MGIISNRIYNICRGNHLGGNDGLTKEGARIRTGGWREIILWEGGDHWKWGELFKKNTNKKKNYEEGGKKIYSLQRWDQNLFRNTKMLYEGINGI